RPSPPGQSPLFAERRARPRAVDQAALLDLSLVGGVFALVVGGVELLLVHVAPYRRTFGARHCRAVALAVVALELGTKRALVGHGHGCVLSAQVGVPAAT